MSNIARLNKHIEDMLAELERLKENETAMHRYSVVIYDQATGEPLPGNELTEENSHVLYKGVRLPKKLYLVPANDNWLEEDGIES